MASELVKILYFVSAIIMLVQVQGQYNYIPPPPTHPTSIPPSAVLPSRILTGDPGCYREEGFYANENDCAKFYRCVYNGKYYKRHDFDCAPGTVYDPTIEVCNFPGAGGTLQGCKYSGVRLAGEVKYHHIITVVEPQRETRPPPPPKRRPVVQVVLQQDDYDEPNSGNYGEREPIVINRRPNSRGPLNPNRNNVRVPPPNNENHYNYRI